MKFGFLLLPLLPLPPLLLLLPPLLLPLLLQSSDRKVFQEADSSTAGIMALLGPLATQQGGGLAAAAKLHQGTLTSRSDIGPCLLFDGHKFWTTSNPTSR